MLIRWENMQVGVCTSFTGSTKVTEYYVVCGAAGVCIG